MPITKDSRIYVAGHRGLVGSAIVRALKSRGYENLVVRTHGELDLTEQSAVRGFFDSVRPEAVIMAQAFCAMSPTRNTIELHQYLDRAGVC